MRMLRMICRHTLKNRMTNQSIPKMTGDELVKKFLTGRRLRWFGRVDRMSKKAPIMNIKITVKGKNKERLRKQSMEFPKVDMGRRALRRKAAKKRQEWTCFKQVIF